MSTNHCRLINILIAMFILSPFISKSQVLPPHQFTVYDTTVTGYYFLATKKMTDNQTGYPHKQIILDHKGNVVYYKAIRGGDFKMQPNGKITCSRGPNWVILDSTFTVVDTVSCLGYKIDTHDFQILSNNHYLLLGLHDSIMDLSAYHFFKKNGTAGSTSALVTGSVIQELDSNKNLLFEWRTLDHLPFNSVDTFYMGSNTVVDWTHSNALEIDYDGNILMSSRHLNEITKINRTTGDVMWRMGGNYNEFTFINDPFPFWGQHDIRTVGNGRVTLLDNGKHYTSHGARGVEYQLDEVNKTATLMWDYTYDPALWSGGAGNSQRIPGGLNLVNIGHRNFGTHCFSLVDSLNNQISEFGFLDTSVMYRVFFYRTLPWSFHRPLLSCNKQGSNNYIVTSANYSSYLWSTGATTASIQITTPGTYYVDVPYGEGFIRSEDFVVTDIDSLACYEEFNADFNANVTSVCKNSIVNFTELSGGNATSWQWSFPGGTPSSSALQNPSVQYPAAGTYSVTLIAGNNSTHDTIVKTNYIKVNTTPPASITANGGANFCTGGSVQLSANTGTGFSYQWKKGSTVITDSTSSTYTANVAASYKVVVTNQNGCSKISNVIAVTGPPSATITVTGSLSINTCTGDSVKFAVPLVTGNLYQWKKNNANIPGAIANIYYASSPGIYKVVVTNAFGCSKLSSQKTVTSNCRFGDIADQSLDLIKISPNPTSDYFTVTLKSNCTYEIMIYDLSGKKIENHTVTNSDNFIIGENLDAGFYFCEISYQNKKDLFKIVKTKH
ncbi:MAG: aryl-sulfate sulfotransferase [Bacteroidia bacterium]